MIRKLLKSLSSPRDRGSYTGFLSYAAEWHSVALGLAVGLFGSPELQAAVVAYALGRGGERRLREDAHIADMAREPAYAVGGLVIGSLLAVVLP